MIVLIIHQDSVLSVECDGQASVSADPDCPMADYILSLERAQLPAGCVHVFCFLGVVEAREHQYTTDGPQKHHQGEPTPQHVFPRQSLFRQVGKQEQSAVLAPDLFVAGDDFGMIRVDVAFPAAVVDQEGVVSRSARLILAHRRAAGLICYIEITVIIYSSVASRFFPGLYLGGCHD